MKISQFIKTLRKIKEDEGDIEVNLAVKKQKRYLILDNFSKNLIFELYREPNRFNQSNKNILCIRGTSKEYEDLKEKHYVVDDKDIGFIKQINNINND